MQFTGALSVMTQFLTTENPSKVMKKAFYFTLKALFVLKIFKSVLTLWLDEYNISSSRGNQAM